MPHSSAPVSVTCAVITPPPARRVLRGVRVGTTRPAEPSAAAPAAVRIHEDGLELVEGPARGERRGGRGREHGQRELARLDEAELLARLLLHDGVGLELVVEVVEPLVLGPERVELLVALGQGAALPEPRLHGEDEERGDERGDHQHGHRADREPAVAAPSERRRVVAADRSGRFGRWPPQRAALAVAVRPPRDLRRPRPRAGRVVGALGLPATRRRAGLVVGALGLPAARVDPVSSSISGRRGPARPALDRRPSRRGRPRSAGAGCTWPPGRSGPGRRS